MKGETGEIIAGFPAAGADRAAHPHLGTGIRRCKRCGIRKVLDRGFYRDKTSRGGYRQVCKKCRNRERARWARSHYVPKTGRRYGTRAPSPTGVNTAGRGGGREGEGRV